ncbi:DUF2442 domain-containing protein [Gracilimonas mengyeensis]|uniref:DUF2442 domain-containing protein n=1 Tax=Gracilimonas mengyeensis TaxID=1302730 RepID=A0A521CS67_9BACT|nr:DUF2442 domain-containing protein [Gracilimonas mengyeensis]SMO62266.1 Protein of unknown function [Gracilimonas mengyeensis]
MSSLVIHKPVKAKEVWFLDKKLCVLLEDGREIAVPLEWFPKLREASIEELKAWRFIGGGVGIHWEELDEDLSVEAFLNT